MTIVCMICFFVTVTVTVVTTTAVTVATFTRMLHFISAPGKTATIRDVVHALKTLHARLKSLDHSTAKAKRTVRYIMMIVSDDDES